MMAMPTDAPNPDNAYAFLNYLLEPEVKSAAVALVDYGGRGGSCGKSGR